jgi:uncharacterized protein
VDLIVLAKEPLAGRVKTRLCPPFTPDQAAEIAAACLADTLEAAVASGADEVVLVLDGQPGWWCPPGVRIVGQSGGSLGERLESAWSHCSGPAVQIGMDTPQVTPGLLDLAMSEVAVAPEDRAVLGPATDGGWWLLGLRRAVPGAFDGVPMSDHRTAVAQIERLRALGLEVRTFVALTDLDTADDLGTITADAPAGRVAAAVARLAIDRQ